MNDQTMTARESYRGAYRAFRMMSSYRNRYGLDVFEWPAYAIEAYAEACDWFFNYPFPIRRAVIRSWSARNRALFYEKSARGVK